MNLGFLLEDVKGVDEKYAMDKCADLTTGEQVIVYLQSIAPKQPNVYIFPTMLEYTAHTSTKKCMFTAPDVAEATTERNRVPASSQYVVFIVELLKSNGHYHTLLVVHSKVSAQVTVFDPTGYWRGSGGYMMDIFFDKLKAAYPWFQECTLTNDTSKTYTGPQKHEGNKDIVSYQKGGPQGYCATWVCVMGAIISKYPSVGAQELSEKLVQFLIKASSSTAPKAQVQFARTFIFKYQCKVMSLLYNSPTECNRHTSDDEDDEVEAPPSKKRKTNVKSTRLNTESRRKTPKQKAKTVRRAHSTRPRRKCVNLHMSYADV
jgi:hypothetical protein